MTDETHEVRKRVARPAESADDRGRVMKVLFLDDAGEPVGEWASQQIPEDPFSGSRISGLQEPPYSLEQLVYLAEMHPVHSAAIEQKTADVIGKGWEWQGKEMDEIDDAVRNELAEWFEGLSPDDVDMRELLSSVWNDVETVGWGLIECARDPSGEVRRVYHVPGHTVRAAKDGFRLLQDRGGKKVWFRRWGAALVDGKPVEVDAKTGSKTSVKDPANDLFVIRRPSRRSSWYGIPGYISAVGWITLALAARDDNLLFFTNRREPRWAIVLTNIQEDPDLENDLRRAFTVDLRQPHRNIIIPITGPGKIDFQKMTDNRLEGSFDKLSERADRAIMTAHRIPPERLAASQIGPLGGNATIAASRIYKEGVITPCQEILNTRLNRFIAVEYEKTTGSKPTLLLVMDDLDLATDREDLDQTVTAFKSDLVTLREARHRLKLEPLMVRVIDPTTGEPTDQEVESPFNDLLYSQLPGVSSYDDPAELAGSPALEQELAVLVRSAADVQERLEELADRQEASEGA